MNDRDPDRTTLDPPSWEAARTAAHRYLDDLLDHMEHRSDGRVWRAMPAQSFASLDLPLPREGEGLESAWTDLRRLVLPYDWGNTHPRFWGWVNGSGTFGGFLAECAAAAINTNASLGAQAAVLVERQVIRWMVEAFGFPPDASGILTTGGSLANLIGMTVGRDAILGPVAHRLGLAGGPRPMLYCSRETHGSVVKAGWMLGFGEAGIRLLPVDDQFRLDLVALRQAIRADRAAGHRPALVVGNAGTVNTGSFDDLAELRRITQAEQVWLHVDGAFGALAALSPRLRAEEALRSALGAVGLADSLAFDLHKWLHVQYGAGCVLIRNADDHQRSFSPPASYLTHLPRGAAGGPMNLSHYGPELSRDFRALKVWFSLKEHGLDALVRQIERNVAQAGFLAERIRSEPELELLGPVPLNVVVFRYRPTRGQDTDAFNREVLMSLHEEGVAVPSPRILAGRFGVGVAITNHRSQREDFVALVEGTLRIGRRLDQGGVP